MAAAGVSREARVPRLKTLPPRVRPLTPSRQGWAAPHRGTRHRRGYGYGWEVLRERILQRDCSLCQPCRRAGRITIGNAVDHIVPKTRGGTDDEANLQCICEPCHAAKTQRESRG